MPSLRSKSISTKVADEGYAQFESRAGEEALSEWAILLNVHFAVSQGQTLTAEEMRQLIERADQDKLSKARQRLAEATTGGVP